MEPPLQQLMTSDQDAKVVAEPQGQRVQEGKDCAHLVRVGPPAPTAEPAICGAPDRAYGPSVDVMLCMDLGVSQCRELHGS